MNALAQSLSRSERAYVAAFISSSQQVVLRMLDGSQLSLQINVKSNTVDQLKQCVYLEYGHLPASQHIYVGGREHEVEAVSAFELCTEYCGLNIG